MGTRLHKNQDWLWLWFGFSLLWLLWWAMLAAAHTRIQSLLTRSRASLLSLRSNTVLCIQVCVYTHAVILPWRMTPNYETDNNATISIDSSSTPNTSNKYICKLLQKHINMHVSTTHAQADTQELQCLFLFLRYSSFFAWVNPSAHRQENPSMCVSVCVRSWRSENNVTPKGSHHSPFSPSSLIPPLCSVPAGISLFSSGEMSDLFHHPSHRGWTVPSIHSTSVKHHKSASFLYIRAK